MIPDDPSAELWEDGAARHDYCFSLPAPVLVAFMCDIRTRTFGPRRYVEGARHWLCGLREDLGECSRWLQPRFPGCFISHETEERRLLCDLLALVRQPTAARLLAAMGPPDYAGRHLWWDAMLDEGYQPCAVQTAPLEFASVEEDK